MMASTPTAGVPGCWTAGGTVVGPRVRSARVAGVLIALAVAGPVLLAVVGGP